MLIRVGGYWTIRKWLKGEAVWTEFDRRTIFLRVWVVILRLVF